MPAYRYKGMTPVVDPASFVHPTASLIGDVIVGPGCYIGAGASLRGDFGRITVVGDSSLQDNVTVHSSPAAEVIVGRGSTIAHGAILHGCILGANTLVGMNAVVLDNAEIGPEFLVAALSLVKADSKIPERSLVVGNPAKVVKTFEERQVTWRNNGLGEYQELARQSLVDFTECAALAAPEVDRPRIESNAIAVRLKGPAAEARERRMAAELNTQDGEV